MPFNIKDDQLYYDDELLGSTSAIYVDHNELKGVPTTANLVRRTMPHRIDMVFVAGGSVVGIESKKANDLRDSFYQSRLARQIRTLIREVDIPCLMVRGIPVPQDIKWCQFFHKKLLKLWLNLVQLQCVGVYILPGPALDKDMEPWLSMYRATLVGGRVPLASLARTDQKPTKLRTSGWFLTNIKGVGAKFAAKLYKHFGSTRKALNATPEEWRELGVPQAAIDRKEEALK